MYAPRLSKDSLLSAFVFAICMLAASLAAQGCSGGGNADVTGATLLRTGGQCLRIALYGGYAYCADTDGLNVYAIGDGTNVTLVKEIPVVQSTLGFLAVVIKDKYLYTWNKPNFEVYDLTEPENPTVAFQAEKPPIRDMLIDGAWLYAGCDDGLAVYDITNPIAPELKKTMPSATTSLWLQGTYLYADAGRNGFLIYDVTDPTEPVVAGGWPEDSGEQSLEVAPLVVKGTHLWGANDRGVLAFDVTDPAASTRIDSVPSLSRPVVGMALHGDLLVVSQTQTGVHDTVEFRDIAADPANPPIVHVWDGEVTTGMGYRNATIFNDFAEDSKFFYLAGKGGLVIWKKGQ